jgi:multiple sugar transport system substrate-binding protein
MVIEKKVLLKGDRVILAVAVLLLAGSLAFFFFGKAEAGFPLRTKTEIVFAQWWETRMEGDVLSEIIDEFEAENPLITVRLLKADWEEIRDALLYDVGADDSDTAGDKQSRGGELGSAPDIFALDAAHIGELTGFSSAEPLLAPLDSLMTAETADTAPTEAAGTVYAVPVVSFLYPLFYNIDILSAAGYSRPPRTREEFIEYAKKITDPEQGVYGTAISRNVWTDVLPWFWAGGVPLVEASEIRWTGQAASGTLSFLSALNAEGLICPSPWLRREDETLSAFIAGAAAMVILPSQAAAEITAKNPELQFNVTTIPPLASYYGKPVMALTDWSLGVSAKSRHRDEAVQFLRYLIERKNRIAIAAHGIAAEETGGPPLPDEDTAVGQKLKSLAESSDIALLAHFSARPADALNSIRDALLPMFSGNAAPSQTSETLSAFFSAP